ncbi:MAG: DUF4870 domain-containing protein [Planctomycetota bacterium]|jgi:uncharacterized Tic20 family protein
MAETDETQQAGPSAEDESPQFSSSFESVEDDGIQQLEMNQDARNMAMLCHVLGVFGFIGPLIIWLSEREKHRFVDEHGRDVMNYQISMMIYFAVAYLSLVLLVGFVLVPALTIAHIVLIVMGAIKAQRGELWHYPIALPFLK